MKNKDKIPLLEAVFELRWGQKDTNQYTFTADEQNLLAGQLSNSAQKSNYLIMQDLNPNLPKLPHIVRYRFLQQEDILSPAFQLGLGIFTINQIKEGYKWESFKKTINSNIKILKEANQSHFESIKETARVILNYQNIFFLNKDDKIEDFFERNFNLKYTLPKEILKNENICDEFNGDISTSFTLNSLNPIGQIRVLITTGMINGEKGFVFTISLESKVSNFIEKHQNLDEAISLWCEKSHSNIKYIFETMLRR